MGTRSNFYKNPSYTYNKDLNLHSALQNLRAYNLATGNLPPNEEPPIAVDEYNTVRHKRRRLPPDQNTKVQQYYDEQPMSHQDYIQKRRSKLCNFIYSTSNFSFIFSRAFQNVLTFYFLFFFFTSICFVMDRREVNSSQAIQEIPANVLVLTSSFHLPLRIVNSCLLRALSYKYLIVVIGYRKLRVRVYL